MRRNRVAWMIALLALLVPASKIHSAGQPGLALLTPQEGIQLGLAEQDWRQPIPRLRGLSRGPRVVIQHPPVKDMGNGPTIEAVSPIDLGISFEQNLAPVDMDSLEVKAKRGLFSLALTGRLKPYVQGENLRAEGLTIPEGKFLIQVEIADTNGVRTTETYRLEVKRP